MQTLYTDPFPFDMHKIWFVAPKKNTHEKKMLIHLQCRRKTTRIKYDPPYIKKPIIKGAGNSNHVSVEEVSLDGSNKLITYGNQFR